MTQSSNLIATCIRRPAPIVFGEQTSLFLDFCRWLSALMVFNIHLRNLIFDVRGPADRVIESSPAWALFRILTGSGHIAVMVFFVISGFLVGAKILRMAPTRKWLLDYAIDRFSRLYVVLIPVLLLSWLLLFITPLPADAPARSTVGFTNLFINLGFSQTILGPSFADNHPLWSLANEFWYYVWFPAIVAVFVARAAWIRVFALVLACALPFYIGNEIAAWFLIWLAGVIAACVRVPGRSWPLWLMLFGLTAVWARFGHDVKHYFWGDLTTGAMFALFLASVRSLDQKIRWNWLWKTAPLHRALAAFSYTLYVAHFVLIRSVVTWLVPGHPTQPFQPSDGKGWMIYGTSFVLVLAACYLLGLLTEAHTGYVRKRIQSMLGSNKRFVA